MKDKEREYFRRPSWQIIRMAYTSSPRICIVHNANDSNCFGSHFNFTFGLTKMFFFGGSGGCVPAKRKDVKRKLNEFHMCI